jgi:hypothetical protein
MPFTHRPLCCRSLALVCGPVLPALSVGSYLITTVAGSGTRGFSGDGGPATWAQLWSPYGVAVDASGNLFIADSGDGRIRKVTPQGIISTVAGNGGAGFSGDGGLANARPIAYSTRSGGRCGWQPLSRRLLQLSDSEGSSQRDHHDHCR